MRIKLFIITLLIFLTSCATSHKISQMDQKTWAEFRNEWIDMDKKRFSEYVWANKKMFHAAPDHIQAESLKKWYSLYPDKIYPPKKISTSKKESRPSKKPNREVSTAPCWGVIFEILFGLLL